MGLIDSRAGTQTLAHGRNRVAIAVTLHFDVT